MHAQIPQNTATGKKGLVEDQNELRKEKEMSDPQAVTRSVIDEHRMQGCDHHQPGHQRGILYGVPGPIATEAQRLIGPCAAHHNAGAEDTSREQYPRQRHTCPTTKITFPQPRYRKSKRHYRRAETQEQDRRMD